LKDLLSVNRNCFALKSVATSPLVIVGYDRCSIISAYIYVLIANILFVTMFILLLLTGLKKRDNNKATNLLFFQTVTHRL
jgi:hypothetical protein